MSASREFFLPSLSLSLLHLAFYSPFGCKFRCLAKLLQLSLSLCGCLAGAVFQDFLRAVNCVLPGYGRARGRILSGKRQDTRRKCCLEYKED